MKIDLVAGCCGAADGMAWVVHNDPRGVTAVGATGGALGYAGTVLQQINASAGFRFDTYSNVRHGG